MKCGRQHEHATIEEVRACYVLSPDGPVKNMIPQGPAKPGPSAQRNAKLMEWQDRNTHLAREGKPHGFTSHCPKCLAGIHHPPDERYLYFKAEFAEQERQQEEAAFKSKMDRDAALPQVPSPVPDSWPDRPNRYGGKCSLCGASVEAEEGILTGSRKVGYGVKHRPGECEPMPDINEAAKTFFMPDKKYLRDPLPEVPAGHYAIQSATGNNDMDFFRVDRPDSYKDGGHSHEAWIGEWKGRTFIKRVIGGKPDKNIRRTQYREVLNAILKMGIQESGALYAEKIGACKHCNRHLTDELSRQRASGPDCYDSYGF